MNNYKLLESFLDDWNQDVRCNITDRPFIKDGIINPEKFSKQKIKVLFISNESNIDGGKFDSNVTYDTRKCFNAYLKDSYDSWPGKLRERVSSLYQVVIQDYSMEPYKYVDCFSFMNLNKTGGGKKIDERLTDFCQKYSDRIKTEISLIAPDLIIWLGCNTFDNTKIRKEYVGIVSNKGLYKFNDIPVIRMWHTSYYQCRGKRLGVFENRTIDKIAYKLRKELETIE